MQLQIPGEEISTASPGRKEKDSGTWVPPYVLWTDYFVLSVHSGTSWANHFGNRCSTRDLTRSAATLFQPPPIIRRVTTPTPAITDSVLRFYSRCDSVRCFLSEGKASTALLSSNWIDTMAYAHRPQLRCGSCLYLAEMTPRYSD